MLHDADAARSLAEQIATQRLGIVRQIDTYFHCPTGRLKLRVSDPGEAQLIGYQRENTIAAKPSDYHLVEIAQPEELLRCLESTLGIWKVVEKHREIFLYHNVRIHLDHVPALGNFLEFEAVLDDKHDEPACRALVDRLQEMFELARGDLLSTSYSDIF